ncbi:uncharacterized protein LOC121877066 [Homarus americanus]|uniref:Uncharacterized protein n=1 Tax=Homarus americanus TaxID=6706 RepID=A0A8J5JQG8_HOMAM|nr:uncharacterized protein LOC121877066 [Homarus americanus]XP_042238626.1 uncharacterized protein LOC121877066 [Homarus americanus]XP_042238628.1 uncharacterized protein LOC121877066 [Homarus americanus]KAG7159775.1 hypothetical protein Hamer_G024193 [Homarus americanus]
MWKLIEWLRATFASADLVAPRGIMRVWVWVMMWACMGRVVWVYPTWEVNVGVDAPYCEYRSPTLVCDYKKVNQMVNMVQVNDTVQMVFVNNAVKLQLSESVCVSVMLKNVADVVVVKGKDHPCHRHLTLSATNSTLNRLPGRMGHVHLEDVNITSLDTTVNITQFIVINSIVKVLDISSPLTSGASVDFVSTHIDTLQSLHVADGSEVLLQKTKLHDVASKAVIIDGGNLVMRNSSIVRVAEESVIMFPGSHLSLEHFFGSLRVKAVESVAATSRPTPQCPTRSSECEPVTSYLGGFVTCLLLLMVSVTINILGVVYVKHNYPQNVGQKTTEEHQDQREPESCVEYSKDEEENLLLQQSPSDSFLTYINSLSQLLKDFSDDLQSVNSKHESFTSEVSLKDEAEMSEMKDNPDGKLSENNESKTPKILELEKEIQELKSSANDRDKTYILRDTQELLEAEYKSNKLDNTRNKNAQKLVDREKVCSENHQLLNTMAEMGQGWLSRWNETLTTHDEIMTQLSPVMKLFIITDNLLSCRINDVLSKYKQQRPETERIIMSLSEEEDEKFREIENQLLSQLPKQEQQHLQGRDFVRKFARHLMGERLSNQHHSLQLELLKVRHYIKLQQEMMNHSRADDKLRHREALVRHQEKHLTDIQTILNTILFIQSSYVALLKQIFDRQTQD